MGGCALLLQNWAWYRLSCVAPESPKPWIFPLAQRFNSGGLNFAKVPHNDVEGYRKTIDHMMVEEFYWRPYLGFQHEVSEEDRATWSACTYLLCYHIVEKHHTDRVTLQFGLHQQIPQPPEDMKSYHEVDMRRGIDDNWTWVWREEINHWNERHNYVLQGNIVQGVLCHSTEYMIWFRQHTKLFISVEQYLRDPRLQPPSYPRVQSTSQSTPQHQYTAGQSSSSPHIHVATEDGLLYNLFGTQCTTHESAYVVFDSMYNQQSQNLMEAGGSGSNPSTSYIEENDQNDDEPEEPQLVQRARRVRRHRDGKIFCIIEIVIYGFSQQSSIKAQKILMEDMLYNKDLYDPIEDGENVTDDHVPHHKERQPSQRYPPHEYVMITHSGELEYYQEAMTNVHKEKWLKINARIDELLE
ncbi:uncharacterized protein [Cicer arietinum]|uniref:Uncharacterized protein LOC105852973 n=1 Tax=Cicer arietinum TaxID=3827 RepID=A0A1S3EJ03_CICAR|nr:uncharacterized protein LOC105852973 [Cicer arietinum]